MKILSLVSHLDEKRSLLDISVIGLVDVFVWKLLFWFSQVGLNLCEESHDGNKSFFMNVFLDLFMNL